MECLKRDIARPWTIFGYEKGSEPSGQKPFESDRSLLIYEFLLFFVEEYNVKAKMFTLFKQRNFVTEMKLLSTRIPIITINDSQGPVWTTRRRFMLNFEMKLHAEQA